VLIGDLDEQVAVAAAQDLADRHGVRAIGAVPTEGSIAMAAAAGVNLVEIPPTDLMLNGPIGRAGTPDDIARVALFCASDLSAFTTGGSTLLADGGETA